MNIDKEEYIKSLEERIEKLEKLFEHLCIAQCKEITLTRCSLGDIKLVLYVSLSLLYNEPLINGSYFFPSVMCGDRH